MFKYYAIQVENKKIEEKQTKISTNECIQGK